MDKPWDEVPLSVECAGSARAMTIGQVREAVRGIVIKAKTTLDVDADQEHAIVCRPLFPNNPLDKIVVACHIVPGSTHLPLYLQLDPLANYRATMRISNLGIVEKLVNPAGILMEQDSLVGICGRCQLKGHDRAFVAGYLNGIIKKKYAGRRMSALPQYVIPKNTGPMAPGAPYDNNAASMSSDAWATVAEYVDGHDAASIERRTQAQLCAQDGYVPPTRGMFDNVMWSTS